MILVSGGLVTGQDTPSSVELAVVVRVIDGDTIDVNIGGAVQRVRYIGINTPETDEPCGDDATTANAGFVEGKTVAMVRDVSEVNDFDRLLRNVYVDSQFVNAALVSEGGGRSGRLSP